MAVLSGLLFLAVRREPACSVGRGPVWRRVRCSPRGQHRGERTLAGPGRRGALSEPGSRTRCCRVRRWLRAGLNRIPTHPWLFGADREGQRAAQRGQDGPRYVRAPGILAEVSGREDLAG